MDWGIQDLVQFLSEGEINPPEIFGYEDHNAVDAAFALRVREHMEDPDTAYVFRDRPHFAGRWEAFQAIVSAGGLAVVDEQVIYDWSAIPIYRIVRVGS
jgi:hypothetical protein